MTQKKSETSKKTESKADKKSQNKKSSFTNRVKFLVKFIIVFLVIILTVKIMNYFMSDSESKNTNQIYYNDSYDNGYISSDVVVTESINNIDKHEHQEPTDASEDGCDEGCIGECGENCHISELDIYKSLKEHLTESSKVIMRYDAEIEELQRKMSAIETRDTDVLLVLALVDMERDFRHAALDGVKINKALGLANENIFLNNRISELKKYTSYNLTSYNTLRDEFEDLEDKLSNKLYDERDGLVGRLKMKLSESISVRKVGDFNKEEREVAEDYVIALLEESIYENRWKDAIEHIEKLSVTHQNILKDFKNSIEINLEIEGIFNDCYEYIEKLQIEQSDIKVK